MTRKRSVFYATRHEQKFLDGLGTYRDSMGILCETSREDLLKGYLQGAMRRTDWGDIDSKTIIARVQSELGDHCGLCGRLL